MLNQLIETSKSFDKKKTDYGPALTNTYSFDKNTAQLLVPATLFHGYTALEPTDWALGQVCQKLGPAAFPGTAKVLPRDYLQACPAEMRAEQLNHWIDVLPDERQWFVRGYENTARAVLSERYSSVGVTETLKWVKEALDSKGGLDGFDIYRPTVTPDVLHLKVLFREVNTDDGPYKIGGYFTTGEIGNRKIGAFPLIQRHSCTNSIMVPKNAYSWESRHTGHTHVLKSLFIAAIFQTLKGAVEVLDKMLEARNKELPDFGDFVDDLIKSKGWSVELHDSILLGAEGNETLFGLVNGVSAVARDTEDADLRADMELVAGELLYRR